MGSREYEDRMIWRTDLLVRKVANESNGRYLCDMVSYWV